MEEHRDFRTDRDEYQFIRETIKKRPRDYRARMHRAACFLAGGVLFGVGAAGAFSVTAPILVGRFGRDMQRGDRIRLAAAPTPAGSSMGSIVMASEAESLSQDSQSVREETDPLISYEETYNRIVEVTKEPRKALVTVECVSEDASLLDSSMLIKGSSEGIIFLENDLYYYILTELDQTKEEGLLQVVFSDAATAEGKLCQSDPFTGLAVVKVPLDELEEDTKEQISAVRLTDSDEMYQAKTVIAIGSPTGEADGVLYGGVTAVSGKYSVPDAEYGLIATDMHGSADGKGFLLDTKGDVVGVITQRGSEDTHIIRAFDVSSIRGLVEAMSNEGTIKFLGIYGKSIPASRTDAGRIPRGIYVSKVENASPAMEAGILRGDIITSLGEKSLKTMESYMHYLQNQKVGEKIKLTAARDNGSGIYEEIELEVIIRER